LGENKRGKRKKGGKDLRAAGFRGGGFKELNAREKKSRAMDKSRCERKCLTRKNGFLGTSRQGSVQVRGVGESV